MNMPYIEESMDAAELIAQMRLTKDLQAAASRLDKAQARYLVDFYYTMQDLRIRAAGQIRAMNEAGEPNELLQWTLKLYARLEADTKDALKIYAETSEAGRWAMRQMGIGPVIAAGLLAHIDITRSLTAGQVWSFAGYNPTVKWLKGEKRPWNAKLKTLGWKAAQSFIMFSGKDDCFYGKIYQQRKAYEQGKNERLEYADQAREALLAKKFGVDTKAREFYEKGMLPPAHIQARVSRYTAKIFLSHFHKVLYESYYGKKAPTPWIIQFGGHVHEIFPPGWTSPAV